MSFETADRVLETTTTTGTGTLDLAGAATGHQTFVAGIGDGNVCFYCIDNFDYGGGDWEVGIGTVTDAAPDTLSRDHVLASSNSGAAVNFSSGTKDVFVTNPASRLGNDPTKCQGRLTLVSGTPVPQPDQSAKTTVYYTPYHGNLISLYNNGAWLPYTFSELSLSTSGFTASVPNDIFVYDNSGTITLEAVAWTNNTTRATSLTVQDGIQVKSGDATRRYAGTVLVDGSKQAEDTRTQRYVYNHYNQVPRTIAQINTNSHTYTTASWREWNNSTSSRFEWVDGDPNPRQFYFVYRANVTGSGAPSVSFAINSTSGPNGSKGEQFNNFADAASSDSFDGRTGYNFFTGVEFGSSGPTFERISTGGVVLL